MDAVFKALAGEPRRRILDILKERPGANVNQVCGHFAMSRIAVMKHLKQLEEAGLVVSERVGRERRLYHNPVPIQMIYDRWTTQYSAFWARRLADIKYRVEGESRGKRKGKRKGKGRK